MTTDDVMTRLRELGLSDRELAARTGIARETISRWRSGAQRPTLDALERLVAAAGAQLEVRVERADPEHVALVGDQLDLGPTEAVRSLLGPQAWAGCRDALRAVATLGDLAVLVGPVAAAISGAPQRPGEGRVDVLVSPREAEQVFERLLAARAHPDGVEASPDASERRERWSAGRGLLTVRTAASGVDVDALRGRARPVGMTAEDIGVVYVALVEDLLDVTVGSPWSEDSVYLPGLRAVLASGRYSSRQARLERAA